jgi:type II secretory ATPase GspE/PulE/Tfp pilus assembly ATPase PilB-like protein
MVDKDQSPEEEKKDFGELLVEGSFISPEELEHVRQVADSSNKKLTEVLIEEELINSDTLATILSLQYNVPAVDLRHVQIQPAAIALVPENVAREHQVLPLSVDGDDLTIAIEDPENLWTLDTLAKVTQKRVKPVIPLGMSIIDAIGSHYRLTSQIEKQISDVVRHAEKKGGMQEQSLATDAVKAAPIVQAVDMLLSQAVKDRASDIHIEPESEHLRVRYRIDGVLHEVLRLPLGVHTALMTRIKVLSNLNIAERRRPQDGQFSINIGDRQVDFRVACIETDYGEMAVLRVLDKSMLVLKLEDLGMSPSMLEPFQKLLQSAFGMILVSGPTGSGKTTTLYSSLSQLDAKGRNIMTVEDPIEYRFAGINQIQVNRQAGIEFATGLRAIMRLDPDIILVGEIRDTETANTAVQAALTGHLVLTSVHANDAASAVVRLIDMGIEPFLITSAVIGSLSQRLVRKVCTYCSGEKKASSAEVVAYQQEMGEEKTNFHYGRGCNFCSHTGFLGRVGVYELLAMSEPIRKMIMQGASAAELKAAAESEGMINMRRDGMFKTRDGVTTVSEVLRNVFTIL